MNKNVDHCLIPTNAAWVVVRKILEARKFLRNMMTQGNIATKLNAVVVVGKFFIHNMYLNLMPVHLTVN